MKYLKALLFSLFVFLPACETTERSKFQSSLAQAVIQAEAVVQPDFVWYVDIIAALVNKFSVTVDGTNIDLLTEITLKSETNKQRTYKSFHRIDALCFRTIVRGYSEKPYVDFWVFTSYGHTGDSRPLYPRQNIVLSLGNTSKFVVDYAPKGSTVSHGMGVLRHFRYNFQFGKIEQMSKIITLDSNEPKPPWFTVAALPVWLQGKSIKVLQKAVIDYRANDNRIYAPFEQSNYTPRFPGRTGGQPQFGCNLIQPERYAGQLNIEVWRKQLYPEASRPSALLKPDGTRTRDTEWPGTIWSSSESNNIALSV